MDNVRGPAGPARPTRPKATKNVVREVLEGYAKANTFIQEERRATLAGIAPEEAWATFRTLWRTWETAGRNRDDLESLDALRIERSVQQRRVMDRLATRRV